MAVTEEEELFNTGKEALAFGNTKSALDVFRRLVAIERQPIYCSSLAVCIAKEKHDFRQAISLCNEAIRKEPKHSEHFYHLGQVYLMAGNKKDAIRILRMGLRHGRNRDIVGLLEKMGYRKSPVLPFLRRENPVNKYLGIVLARMGLR